MGKISFSVKGAPVEEFNWMELKFGTNRGISIGGHHYALEPNPHQNPDYPGKEGVFYTELVTNLARLVSINGWIDKFTNVIAKGVQYTLNRRDR